MKVCHRCWLVQTEDYARAEELFSADYAYFSSTSRAVGWITRPRYARMITERLQLGPESFVIEVASNDGYLLKNFLAAGIPCLGIEPTASTAAAAEALGIPVMREFFGEASAQRLAGEGRAGRSGCGQQCVCPRARHQRLHPRTCRRAEAEGTVTLEFPHLMPLIEHTQFDTIYHEHFSYLSLTAVARIFAAAALRVWDVEELPTHGGSLRVYGCHAEAAIATTNRVDSLLTREDRFGVTRLATYTEFQKRADRVKDDLLAFLIEQKRAGRSVAAYGAAAKGNTLLNYAGVRPDLLPYVCDAAPSKQGRFMPGSHIPIVSPEALREDPPRLFVVILPRNIAHEVRTQLNDLVRRGQVS